MFNHDVNDLWCNKRDYFPFRHHPLPSEKSTPFRFNLCWISLSICRLQTPDSHGGEEEEEEDDDDDDDVVVVVESFNK